MLMMICCEATAGNHWTKDGRVLYEGCEFCDDDMPSDVSCVYLNCRFNLSGQSVIDRTQKAGCVFLNCDFVTEAKILYLTLHGGQVALVDCRFTGSTDSIAWSACHNDAVCYQSGVMLNGGEYLIDEESPSSVVMDGLPLLDAYRFRFAEKDYYNVYNLLSGYDGWDPLAMADTVLMAQEYYGRRFSGLPVMMSLSAMTPDDAVPEVQKASMTARTMSGAYVTPAFVGWSVSDDRLEIDENRISAENCYIMMQPSDSLHAASENAETDNAATVDAATVSAVTDYGLEASLNIRYPRQKIAAPGFNGRRPVLSVKQNRYVVEYDLDLRGSEDRSRILWFSADDSEGRYGLRLLNPSSECNSDHYGQMREYRPNRDDVGRYIVVRIDTRSDAGDFGEAAVCVSDRPVRKRMVGR